MPLRKFARFVAALLLGLVLALSSYPAYSQEFPSFDDCLEEVNAYPNYDDLDEYNERQVYCLFVVEELIYGRVDTNKEYDNEELDDLILSALEDTGDDQNGDKRDDKLTFAEIEEEFPGNELDELIDQSIREADKMSSLFQSSPFQVAAARITSVRYQSSSALAQANGKTRGGSAVKEVAANAAKAVRK